jgi:hypothetical protein
MPQPRSARGYGISCHKESEYSHFVTPMAQHALFADFINGRAS